MVSLVISNCAGPEIIGISKLFEYIENKSKDPAILMRKIEQICNPQQNKCLEAYKFWKLSWSSGSFDRFLNKLRKHADTCNFVNLANRMMRDKLVFLFFCVVFQITIFLGQKIDKPEIDSKL